MNLTPRRPVMRSPAHCSISVVLFSILCPFPLFCPSQQTPRTFSVTFRWISYRGCPSSLRRPFYSCGPSTFSLILPCRRRQWPTLIARRSHHPPLKKTVRSGTSTKRGSAGGCPHGPHRHHEWGGNRSKYTHPTWQQVAASCTTEHALPRGPWYR